MFSLFDPSGRVALVTGAAVFLALPAGAFATGHVFVIDCGYMVVGA